LKPSFLQPLQRFGFAIAISVSLASLVAAQTVPPAPPADSAPASAAAPAVAPAPSAAPASVAPAAPSAPNADEGENPYGIGALWAQGDLVARATLLILILMSMATWYVLITKIMEQSKILKQSQAIDEGFWSGGSFAPKMQSLDEDSPFRYIGESTLTGANKFGSFNGAVDLNTWLAMLLQRGSSKVQGKLQGGLAVLATVGSTAPFVGLFGTVWGIYHALVSIGISGQASIDKVAGPVGEALIMTAIGLAVAVPAVLGYNWVVRRNKQVMESVTAFATDLHTALLAQVKR